MATNNPSKKLNITNFSLGIEIKPYACIKLININIENSKPWLFFILNIPELTLAFMKIILGSNLKLEYSIVNSFKQKAVKIVKLSAKKLIIILINFGILI